MHARLAIVCFALCATGLGSGCGGGAATVAVAAPSGPAAPGIRGRDARRLVEHGAVLLDVRSPFEYAASHLDGAINIPVEELARRTAELDPSVPVVVYCLSGHRSEEAGRILTGAGFDEVHDLGSLAGY